MKNINKKQLALTENKIDSKPFFLIKTDVCTFEMLKSLRTDIWGLYRYKHYVSSNNKSKRQQQLLNQSVAIVPYYGFKAFESSIFRILKKICFCNINVAHIPMLSHRLVIQNLKILKALMNLKRFWFWLFFLFF